MKYVNLVDAITSSYPTDAHFAAYSCPSMPYRLVKGAEEQIDGILMVALVFDVDCAVAHRTGEPATDRWFYGEMSKVDELLSAVPGGVVSRTRGGFRMMYKLSEPFLVRSSDDAEEWRRRYLRSGCRVATYGVEIDPACSSYVSLFRAPHATRDPSRGPEDLAVLGDPSSMGCWELPTEEDDSDIHIARAVARRNPSWEHVPRRLAAEEPRSLRHHVTSPPVGRGYAHAALRSGAHRVATAPESTRNATLNREAFQLFRLVDNGVTAATVKRELSEAALSAGLEPTEAMATIESAFSARRRR